jgi:hypothetical protein
MDTTQIGRAGELALALYAMVTSDGELEMFTPVADDDHVDATAGRRRGVPAIAIQVKTAPKVDRDGLAEARASYPTGKIREHPAFLYAVLLLSSVTIEALWLVPSPDFNRLVYRTRGPRQEILQFRAYPSREDRFSSFRVPPLDVGPRLLAVIDSLQEHIPLPAIDGPAGLLLGARRPR